MKGKGCLFLIVKCWLINTEEVRGKSLFCTDWFGQKSPMNAELKQWGWWGHLCGLKVFFLRGEARQHLDSWSKLAAPMRRPVGTADFWRCLAEVVPWLGMHNLNLESEHQETPDQPRLRTIRESHCLSYSKTLMSWKTRRDQGTVLVMETSETEELNVMCDLNWTMHWRGKCYKGHHQGNQQDWNRGEDTIKVCADFKLSAFNNSPVVM